MLWIVEGVLSGPSFDGDCSRHGSASSLCTSVTFIQELRDSLLNSTKVS